MKTAACLLLVLAASRAQSVHEDRPGWSTVDGSPSAHPTETDPLPGSTPLPVGRSSVVLDPLLAYEEPWEGGGHVGDWKRKVFRKTPLLCFVYKPAHWSGERMILVLHGTLRNADEYRDDAVVLGDRFDALVVAPQFDKERFPNIKYQRGGIMKEDGTAASPPEWTYALVPQVASEMRRIEGRPALKHWIIGHSAGGQFAMRMSAFQDTGAERIVAANPGTDLFPTRAMKFGWGFGGLPEELSSDEVLKRYLDAPLTLYLATEDDQEDEYLDMSPASVEQGPGRYQRGKKAFALAMELSREKGWPCNWRLVEAAGVDHDHTKMFEHEKCRVALFGD